MPRRRGRSLVSASSGIRAWNGIEQYNRINKQEPLDRAMRDLGAETWFAGLRRVQAATRARIAPIEFKRGRYKVHPLFDWTDRDVGRYLAKHRLPYHPLWEKGYLSIGDWHTTRSLAEVDSMEELRFFGLKRECGLRGESPRGRRFARRNAAREMSVHETKTFRSGDEAVHETNRRSLTMASMIAISVRVSCGGQANGRPRGKDDAGNRSHQQTRKHTKVHMT